MKMMRSTRRLLVLVLFLSACVPIPHSVNHNVSASGFSIIDERTGTAVSDALMLEVQWVWAGMIDGPTDRDERHVVRAFEYNPREELRIYNAKGLRWGVLPTGHDSITIGLIVLAPGYCPKYFMVSGKRPSKGKRLVWGLRPLPASEAEARLREVLDVVRQPRGGVLSTDTWDAWGEGFTDKDAREIMNEPRMRASKFPLEWDLYTDKGIMQSTAEDKPGGSRRPIQDQLSDTDRAFAKDFLENALARPR